MEDLKNLLTQEQKEWLCTLHWKEGTLFEEEYYYDLMTDNEQLRAIFDEATQEANKEFGFGPDYEFECEDYDEWLLWRMQYMDEKLGVGLYNGGAF